MSPTCPAHPERPVTRQCGRCQGAFCEACVAPGPEGPRCGTCARLAPPVGPPRALVCCGLAFGLLLPLAAVSAIALAPRLFEGRRLVVDEAGGRAALEQIVAAQRAYRSDDLDRNGVKDYGALRALVESGALDSAVLNGRHGFRLKAAAGTKNPEEIFWAAAVPENEHGRAFFTNQTGRLYALELAASPDGSRGELVFPDPATGEPPPGATLVGP